MSTDADTSKATDRRARLTAKWEALNARQGLSALSEDRDRADTLTESEAEGMTQREMAECIRLTCSRVTNLLRYRRFLLSAESNITERTFRDYWTSRKKR